MSLVDRWESVVIVPCRACNRKCSFCRVGSNGSMLSPKAMSIFLKLIMSLNCTHGLRIKLQGGEPLLCWANIEEVILKNITKSLKFVITTNAKLLDERKANFLNKNQAACELVVSIDTQKWNLHNPKRLDNKLDLLEKTGLINRCAFNFTITPDSQDLILSQVSRLKAKGACDFRFFPAYYIKWDRNSLTRLSETFDFLVRLVGGKIPPFVTIPKSVNKLEHLLRRSPGLSNVPLAGDHLLLDSNGDILLSDAFLFSKLDKWRKGFTLGNVLKKGWQDNIIYLQRNPRLWVEKLHSLNRIYSNILPRSLLRCHDELSVLFSNFTRKLALRLK